MTDTTTDTDTRQRQAYDKATSALRENHRQEFNELRSKFAADLGVEWKPRPTAEERAAAKAAADKEKADAALSALVEKFPHLADRVIPAGQEAEASPEEQVL